MSYRLVYTQRAIKDIARLDAAVKKRLGVTLPRFTDNPLKYAERLTNSELGCYRFRMGDYRVIVDIEGNDIVVLRVGHRKGILKENRFFFPFQGFSNRGRSYVRSLNVLRIATALTAQKAMHFPSLRNLRAPCTRSHILPGGFTL